MMTKTIDSKDLFFQEGSSDKVYYVQINENDINDEKRFLVNFQYGKRGSTLKAETKTKDPVTLEEANKIFNKIVKEKVTKGYQENGSSQSAYSIVKEQKDTGIYPQLLCPIDDDLLDKYINDDNYVAQEKFDGQRRMFNFNNKNLTSINKKGQSVANLIEIENIFSKSNVNFICDGEIIGNKYFLFDIISYNNQDVKSLSYEDRLEIIKKDKILSNLLVKTINGTENKKKFFEKIKLEKGEELVFKDIKSKYSVGRPASGGPQIKYKFWESATLEVISHNKSKRSVEVGAYKDNSLISLGSVTIPSNYNIPPVGEIVEVIYLYAFEGGAIYQSKYKGIREDQNKDDCKISQLKYKKENIEEDDEEILNNKNEVKVKKKIK